MSTEAVTITISGNIKGDVAARIREIGIEALKADSSLEILKATIGSFSAAGALRAAGSDVRELRNEINRTTQAQRTFSAENGNTAKSLLAATAAANKYDQALQRIDGATVRMGRSTGNLSGLVGNLVGLFGGLFALRGYAQAQDALTTVQNQIRVITDGTAEAAALQDKLFELANRTRSGIEQTTTAYTNFYKQLSAIGTSEQEIFRIVETLNKGFQVGGRSAAEAAGSTRQLIQGLQSGTLRGEEFNSVMEAFPVEIIQAFADRLGVGVEGLRKMAEAGAITREVIRDALGAAAADVDALFAKTVPTIGNALTVLQNKFILFTSSTTGGAGLIVQAINFIGDSLNVIIPLVFAFAAAWLAIKAYGVLFEIGLVITTQLIPALLAVNAVTILWVAIIGTVTAGIAALVYLIKVATGYTGTFSDFIGESVEQIKSFAVGLVGMGEELAKGSENQKQLTAAVKASNTALTTAKKSTDDLTSSTKAYGEQVKQTMTQTIQQINNAVAAYNRLTDAQRAAGDASQRREALKPGSSFTTVGAPKTDANGNSNSVTAFARGGSLLVGGRSGTDRNLVQFRASRGERVDVSTPSQQRAAKREGRQDNAASGNTYNFNVSTPDADSFRRSRGQMAREISSVVNL